MLLTRWSAKTKKRLSSYQTVIMQAKLLKNYGFNLLPHSADNCWQFSLHVFGVVLTEYGVGMLKELISWICEVTDISCDFLFNGVGRYMTFT